MIAHDLKPPNENDPTAYCSSENRHFAQRSPPPILLVQIVNPRTIGIEYIAGAIGGTIVDNNDLNRREGLVQYARNSMFYAVRVVVGGYDGCDRE
jgi:hypothetical protein